MVDVRGTGLSAPEFVSQLYDFAKVSVLDATAFGASAEGFVRVSYTSGDSVLEDATSRIDQFANHLTAVST